ncbi:MAG TPA: DUF1150 family protein [Alphaproteobacteria bacterium]|jgi:hypothetical protein
MADKPEWNIESDAKGFRRLSDEQFAVLGLNRVAYVKPVAGSGGSIVYEVHAAEGSKIAEIEDRAVAFAAVRQYDMEPVSVH